MKKILVPLTICAALVLVVTSGCVQPAGKAAKPAVAAEKPVLPAQPEKETAKPEKPVILKLKLAPQDTTTYRVVTEAEKSVKFEGSMPTKTNIRGGKTGNTIDITFTQQIESVDNKGNAIANITFKKLKYLAKSKDTVTLDFDSSRAEDQKRPMNELIGRSYKIALTPAGRVLRIIDANELPVNPEASSAERIAFTMLFDPNSIKERHTIDALPADKKELRVGDTWSRMRPLSFGLMGSKTYERTYTLKDVKEANGRQIAEVEMSGVAELKTDTNQTGSFHDMFDTIETYSGHLEFDVTSGKAENYSEKLNSEWTVVRPEEEAKAGKEPYAMIMGMKLSWSMERVE
jgi:hypothetical protein